jgi:hypothetical protein
MEKNLYIKTEPGGKVSFGRLSESDLDLFSKSKINNKLSADILYKLKKGLPPYRLVEGVVNSGNNGEIGNEGYIDLDKLEISIPYDDEKKYQTGTYIAYLSLSKVSIEFKITDKFSEVYDSKKLSELSVAIKLPDCVAKGIYSDLKFNIVTGYKYDGKIIKNANKGMVDRGYDESVTIFSVRNNKITVLYKSENSNEIFY